MATRFKSYMLFLAALGLLCSHAVLAADCTQQSAAANDANKTKISKCSAVPDSTECDDAIRAADSTASALQQCQQAQPAPSPTPAPPATPEAKNAPGYNSAKQLQTKSGPCGTVDQYKNNNSACQDAVSKVASATSTLKTTSMAAGTAVQIFATTQTNNLNGSAVDAARTAETNYKVAGVAKLAESAIYLMEAVKLKHAASNANRESDSLDQLDSWISEHCTGNSVTPDCIQTQAKAAKMRLAREDKVAADKVAGSTDIKSQDAIANEANPNAQKNDVNQENDRMAHFNSLGDASGESRIAADKAKLAATNAMGTALAGIAVGVGSIQASIQAGKYADSLASVPPPGTPIWSPSYTGASVATGYNPGTAAGDGTTFGGGYGSNSTGSGSLLADSAGNSIGGGLADNSGGGFANPGFKPAATPGVGGGGGGGLGGGSSGGSGAQGPGGGKSRGRGSNGPTGVGLMMGMGGGGSKTGGVATPGKTGVGDDLGKLLANLLGKPADPAEKTEPVPTATASRELASLSDTSGVYAEDINIFEQVSARIQALKEGGQI